MSVRLREIALAVHRGQATLVGEIAGYLVLLAADQCVKQPRGIHPDSVVLDPEGTVRLTGHAVSPEEAEQQLRALLSGLLVELRSPAPNLQRVASRRETRGLPTLVLELEAALVPANRKAAKRSLARLVRDTKRAGAASGSLAPEVAASGQAAPAPLPAVPGGAPLAPLALTPVAPGTFQIEPDFAQPQVSQAPAPQPEGEAFSQPGGAQQELTTVEAEESWASAQIAEARKKWTSDVPPVVEERGADPDPSEQMAEARKRWTSEVPPVVAESEPDEGSVEAESVEPPSPREEEDLTLIDEQVRWDVLDEPEEAPSATSPEAPPVTRVESSVPPPAFEEPVSASSHEESSLPEPSVEPTPPDSLTPPPVAQIEASVASVVEGSDSESVTHAPVSVAPDSALVESPVPQSVSVGSTPPDSLTPPPVSTRARSPRPPSVKKRSSAPPVKKGVQQELFQWAEEEKSAPEPELQVTRPDLPPLRVVPREQLAAMIQLGNAWSSQTPPPAHETEALTPVREALEVSPVEEQLEQGEPVFQLKEAEQHQELELRVEPEPVPESEPEPEPEREEEDILTQLWSGATVRELDEEPLFPFVLEEETAPLQDDVPLLEPEPLELPPRRPSDVGELLRKMRPSSRQK